MKASLALILCVFFVTILRAAEPPRVLPQGKLPDDIRLQPLKDHEGYFPWTPPSSPAAWAARAADLRMQMRVALGIWPEPTRTPLNAVIHGRIDRGDYTVEKVYFEPMPGFFVTGNLYRPKNGGKHAGVLCPHGHWPSGRFTDDGEANVRYKIEKGAEQLIENGRSPIQSRCATLARMGCVVFNYDMAGYADSGQISRELAHGFAKRRPEMNAADGWGFFSPRAESYAESIMGLQTWSSMRAVDFLSDLPDVDSSRIGCTGASGGGTQTFILAALDPRVTAAFPAVMVSTGMQGGCTCENASGLRINTGNIEIAALIAPRSLGMTSADDWTREMETKGFPQLLEHWATMSAASNVRLWSMTQFPHNYNLRSRLAMYEWFNTHLGLHMPEPMIERNIKRLTQQEMSVWDTDHPAPAGGIDFERKLLCWWRDDAVPKVAADLEKIARPGFEALFARKLGREKAAMDRSTFQKDDRGDWILMRGLIENEDRHEAVPAVFFHPKKWNGRTVVWLAEGGKNALFEDNQPNADVSRLTNAGISVIAPDLFLQGEFLFDGQSDTPTRKVRNPREAAAYTYGYNDPLFTQRVHDVLTLLAFVRDHERHSSSVGLLALDKMASVAAAARAMADGFVNLMAVDTQGFRFADVDSIQSRWFLPGGAKYGDLPALLKLGTGALWVRGEDQAPDSSAIDWLVAN